MNEIHIPKSERKGLSNEEISLLRKIRTNDAQLKKRLEQLKDVFRKLDQNEDNYNTEYSCGKYNGLGFAISFLEQSDFQSKPIPVPPSKPTLIEKVFRRTKG